MTSTQTGWNAHTCAHCAILVVDLSHLDSLGAFSEVQTTRIHLDYDIHLAQRAADEERPLFKWLLKVFRIVNGDSTLMTEVSFPLLIQSDGQFQDCWVIDGLDATGQPISRHQQSYISLDHHSLHMTCDEDDELAKYMHTRPLECNVLSRRSIDSAGECLQTCLESHEKCRIEWTKSLRNAPSLANSLAGEPLSGEVLKTDELPNRLLCKYEEGGELKLRLVDAPRTAPFEKSHNCASGFATLSYCWGGRNTNQLTYETKALLSSGLVTSLLPPTLRGIVKFAHDMTLEYNWIDALYIFQDSPEDKNREIPRMGLYYGNYTLTLCAASSANSGSGLSSYQTPSTFGEGVFRLQYRFGDVAGYLRCHEPMNAREPLTTRDWTLQGSLLS